VVVVAAVVGVVAFGGGRVDAVVPVDAGLVVAVVEDTEVVAVVGTDVGVGGGATVDDVLVAEPSRSVSMAVIELGLGTEVPDGTNATVISCPSASLTAPGSWTTTGLFEPGGVKYGHILISSWPCLPASGVPVGHVWPLVYFVLPGICSVLDVNTNLG
jgi:hypothetical protein